jgi:arginase
LASGEKGGPFGWIEEDQRVSLKRLVYIGLRDVDRAEKQILRENGIKAFSMHDIDKSVHSSFRFKTDERQARHW